jgi:hypothetical protein
MKIVDPLHSLLNEIQEWEAVFADPPTLLFSQIAPREAK